MNLTMTDISTTRDQLDAMAELEKALMEVERERQSTPNGEVAPYDKMPQRLETVVEEESSRSDRARRHRKSNKLTETDGRQLAEAKKRRHRLGKESRLKTGKGFHKGKGSGWRVAGVIVKYVKVGRHGYLERAPLTAKRGFLDTSESNQSETQGYHSLKSECTDISSASICNSPDSMLAGNMENQNGSILSVHIDESRFPGQTSPGRVESKNSSSSFRAISEMPNQSEAGPQWKSEKMSKSTSSFLSKGNDFGRPKPSSSSRNATSMIPVPIRKSDATPVKNKSVTNPDRSNSAIARLQDSFSPGGIDYNSSGIEEDMLSSRYSVCSLSSGIMDDSSHVITGHLQQKQDSRIRPDKHSSSSSTAAQLKQENEDLRKELGYENQQKEKLKSALEAIQEDYEKLKHIEDHNSNWEDELQSVQTELRVSKLNNDEKQQLIESLQTENKSIQNEVNTLEKSNAELTTEKEELERKLSSIESQLEEAQNEVKWEENNALSLEAQVESLQIEITQLREDYNRILSDKETIEGEVLSLTSQMEEAKVPIDRSKTPDSRARTPDSQASAASISISEDKLAALKSEVKVWKERHGQLNTEKRVLDKKLDSTTKELENAKKCIKRLESSADAVVSKDADEVRRLAAIKESLEQELSVVKSLAGVRQTQSESLQKELNNIRNLADERLQEIRNLQEGLKNTQKLAKGREHEIDSLQQELVGTSGLAEDRHRQLEQLHEELETAKILADSEHREVGMLMEQLQSINELTESRNREVESLKKEMETATRWAEDKQLELQTLEQDLLGTQRVAEGRQKQIESLQALVAIDLCQASDHSEANSTQGQKTALLLAETRSNREEIERLTRELTVKMKEAAADREVNEYLCNEKYKLQSEKCKLEDELAAVKDEFEKFKLNHTADDKILKAEVNELKAKLNTAEKMKDTLNSEISQISQTKVNLLGSDISETSDRLSSVNFDLASAKVEIESLRREHDVINAALASERKQCENLREEWQKELASKRRLQDKIHDLQVELDTSKATMDASNEYAAQLQQEKNQLHRDFQDTIRKLSDRDHYISKIQEHTGLSAENITRQYEREKHQVELERDSARHEVKRLKDEIELLGERLEQKDSQIISLKQALQELETQQRFGPHHEKEIQVRVLEEELNGTKLLASKLSLEKQSKEEMINDLRDALDKSNRSNTTLKQQLKQQRDATSSLIRNKEREHGDLTQNLTKSEAMLKTAEQNYQVVLESKTQLGTDMKLLENMISTLKTQLIEERSSRKLAEQKVHALKGTLEEERKKRAALKEEISELQLKLSKSEATMNFEKDRIRKMQETINNLESDTNSKDYKVQNLQDQVNKYQLEVAGLKRQLESNEEHWNEKNKYLSSELSYKRDILESDRRKLMDQVHQLTSDLDQKREIVEDKTREVMHLRRQLGDLSVDKEVLQSQLNQTQERLKTEKFTPQRSLDDLDSTAGYRSASRRSSEDFDIEPTRIELQTKPSHSRTHFYHKPISGLTRLEVEQMLFDLNKQIQKQLDDQKEVIKDRNDTDEKKKIATLENELSIERAFRSVEKLQIQALHDEMANLRQLLQSMKRSRDSLATDRNQQHVMNRMEEINHLIAQSHSRAQTLAFTSAGMALMANPVLGMNSKDFIDHLNTPTPSPFTPSN
ncbi:early endosome antigen 1-like isoform X3 [Ptychodera flava]|uniref:early endosome antigen 1-like isoform X3 n=1 Tax=Ptychodera flava TaxID=63121 RepID=UPI00396AADD4